MAIQTCLTRSKQLLTPAGVGLRLTRRCKPPSRDGNVHSATINYSGSATKLLDVIVDGNDLFPGGVFFDLTTIGLNSGNAWVGFTAATGGGDDNQDILSWTFQPLSPETAVINQNTETVLPFPTRQETHRLQLQCSS